MPNVFALPVEHSARGSCTASNVCAASWRRSKFIVIMATRGDLTAIRSALLLSCSVALAVYLVQRRRRANASTEPTPHPKEPKPRIHASDASATAAAQRHEALCNHLALSIGMDHARRLVSSLREPPRTTTIRVNLPRASRADARVALQGSLPPTLHAALQDHPTLDDMLCLPLSGPHARPLLPKLVAVDRACAEAVLRGADVFAPGVLGCSADIEAGDTVSVVTVDPMVTDMETSRGAKLVPSDAHTPSAWVHVGNGISDLGRRDLFPRHDSDYVAVTGVAVRMGGRKYDGAALSGACEGVCFLQNAPSALAVHLLDPQPGDRVLDMCCAPGGKTTHIAQMMWWRAMEQGRVGTSRDEAGVQSGVYSGVQSSVQSSVFTNDVAAADDPNIHIGCVVALDRSKARLSSVDALAARLGVGPIVKCVHLDATKTAKQLATRLADRRYTPPYDRVLLDPPCSALGQRPRLALTASVDELRSCGRYQKRLVECAAELLAPGGLLVYSTCTLSAEENENVVAYALRECGVRLRLRPIPARYAGLGGRGWAGCGLSEEECTMVVRFDPSTGEGDGSIGFFVACLERVDEVG